MELIKVRLGGLPIVAATMSETAQFMVSASLRHRSGERPLYMTSANGQVLSMCAQDAEIRGMFLAADHIHADGQPMVWASQHACSTALPERVATTDLIYETAALAAQQGASFFLLGAKDDVNRRAAQKLKALYPNLQIAGRQHGYFTRDEEACVIAKINAARPDILWVSMGVPLEQGFACRNLSALSEVGIIKTSGGVLDFICGDKKRAPKWMQNLGLEWLYRTYLEPRRLAPRYLKTNLHAAWLLASKSGDL